MCMRNAARCNRWDNAMFVDMHRIGATEFQLALVYIISLQRHNCAFQKYCLQTEIVRNGSDKCKLYNALVYSTE